MLLVALLTLVSSACARDHHHVSRTLVPSPTVDLGYAKYQGVYDTGLNISSFLGLRYAAPPIGDLRWRAPREPQSMAGVQQATQFPVQCLQSGSGGASKNPIKSFRVASNVMLATVPTFGEDCLFLNVFVPGNSKSATKLPVVVFIHGGSYSSGGANEWPSTRDLVAESYNSVIGVQMQYRLGMFGFLAGSEVKTNGSLNAGLLDQQFALQWVQKHIAAFGGDPEQVTLQGESAGAGSVIQHVVAHGGNTTPPLFRAAIASSPYLPPHRPYNGVVAENLFRQAVNAAGCSSASDKLTCLRSKDSNLLSQINQGIAGSGFYATPLFLPVIDGSFLVERPTVTLSKRKVNGKVALAFTNAQEGELFVPKIQFTPTVLTDYISQFFPSITPAVTAKVVALYSNNTLNNVQRAYSVIADSQIVCPSYFLLNAFSGKGFKGEFALPHATHGADLGYIFPRINDASALATYLRNPFEKSFTQGFLSFAKFLDTNKKYDPSNLTPLWGKWSLGNTTEMYFGTDTKGVPTVKAMKTSKSLLTRCQFWNSISNITLQ